MTVGVHTCCNPRGIGLAGAILVVNPPRRPLSLVDDALAGLLLSGDVSVGVCDDGAQLALLVYPAAVEEFSR